MSEMASTKISNWILHEFITQTIIVGVSPNSFSNVTSMMMTTVMVEFVEIFKIENRDTSKMRCPYDFSRRNRRKNNSKKKEKTEKHILFIEHRIAIS